MIIIDIHKSMGIDGIHTYNCETTLIMVIVRDTSRLEKTK